MIRGVLVLIFLLWLIPAYGLETSLDGLMKSLFEAENSQYYGSEKWVAEKVSTRLGQLQRLLNPHVPELKSLGLVEPTTGRGSDAPPAGWEWADEFSGRGRVAGSKAWVSRLLNAKSDSERCRLVQLAYADAVVELSSLKPSREVRTTVENNLTFSSFEKDPALKADYARDQQRALWAMRFAALAFISARPDRSPVIPDGCEPCLKRASGSRDFCLAEIIRARISVLSYFGNQAPRYAWWYRGAGKKSGLRGKWPLGNAMNHCSRPNSAHWYDLLSGDYFRAENGVDALELITFPSTSEPKSPTDPASSEQRARSRDGWKEKRRSRVSSTDHEADAGPLLDCIGSLVAH